MSSENIKMSANAQKWYKSQVFFYIFQSVLFDVYKHCVIISLPVCWRKYFIEYKHFQNIPRFSVTNVQLFENVWSIDFRVGRKWHSNFHIVFWANIGFQIEYLKRIRSMFKDVLILVLKQGLLEDKAEITFLYIAFIAGFRYEICLRKYHNESVKGFLYY